VLSWNDLIGRRLGRDEQYEIVEELGRGGSSRVYRARVRGASYDAAVKVIPNDAEDRIGFVQRFEREVDVIRKLNHPNIVRVYDADKTDEIVYLVLQCVRGGTLRQRLGGRVLPAPQAAAYVIQMARALHHAHQQGIVHRDVKPSNMLVDADDTNHLLLTDFGTAKIQGARGLTKSGTTIGTPEYMSPEQAEGREIDQRADIYALGCVLYEMLATRPPFIGSTPVSVLYQQVHSRPASIRSYNNAVARDLARIIEITLAKRPSDRYGTAEQLADALTPIAAEVIQPASAPWMAGGNLGMTPSAPFSGPLAAPRGARAPRTGPTAPLPPTYTGPLPPTPPTLPASGPLAPFAVGGAPANIGASALPAWLGTAQPNDPPTAPLGQGDEALVGLDIDEISAARRIVRSATPSQPLGLSATSTHTSAPDSSQLERAQQEARFAQPELTRRRQRSQPIAADQADHFDSTPVLSITTDDAISSFEARETEPQTPILTPGGAQADGAPSAATRNTLSSAPGYAGAVGARAAASIASLAPPPAQPPTPAAPSAPISARMPAYGYGPALDNEAIADQLAPQSAESLAISLTPMSLAPSTMDEARWPDDPIDDHIPHEQIETAPTRIVSAGRLGVVEKGRVGHGGPVGRGRRGGPAQRGWLVGGAVAALLALAIVGYLALSASGLGVLGGHSSAPRAQASATARPLPSATSTLNPTPTVMATATGTATPNPQHILDQQAAASFRAVALATFADGSCSNNQSQFSTGERVYVNLCTSYNPANGPMTIQIRQNGVVVQTLVNGQYLAANGSYWYYHSLAAGNYDALVTITLNGYQAVARDLYFTVG